VGLLARNRRNDAAPAAGTSLKRRPALWWRALRTLLLAYVGILIVLALFESKFIFVPTTAAQEWYEPADPRIVNVEFVASTGERIHAWWLPKDGASGAVLFNHGNGGNLSFRSGTLARWSEHLNASVLIYDYPGYGKSSGSPTEANCYSSAEAAWKWLTTEQKIDPRRIVLVGESLGGAMATDLASRYDCRAIVLVKALSSIPDMAQHRFPFLPARWLVRHRFDTAAKLKRCRQPVFLTHGRDDTIVPCACSERLLAAAPGPKEFLCFDANDHNDSLPDEFYPRLRAFLDSHAPLRD